MKAALKTAKMLLCGTLAALLLALCACGQTPPAPREEDDSSEEASSVRQPSGGQKDASHPEASSPPDAVPVLPLGDDYSLEGYVQYFDDEKTLGVFGGERIDASGAGAPKVDGTVWVKPYLSSQMEVACLAWAEYSGGGVTIATSHNKGQSWQTAEIDSIPVSGLYQVWLGFSTTQNGWLALYNEQLPYPMNFSIYLSDDGGKSWNPTPGDPPDTGGTTLNGFAFASPDTAYAAAYGESSTPLMWETNDGGNSWFLSTFHIPEEVAAEGVLSAIAYGVRYSDNSWNTEVYFTREVRPSMFSSYYRFIPTDDGWVWDAPDWTLPDGVKMVDFYEFTNSAVRNAPTGWDGETTSMLSSIWLLDITASMLAWDGAEDGDGNYSFPPSAVQEMADVLYGVPDLDVATVFEWAYDPDTDMVEVGPHGYDPLMYTVRDGKALENGDIEVYGDFYPDFTTVDGPAAIVRYVYRPVEYKGLQLFTLLQSEIVGGHGQC